MSKVSLFPGDNRETLRRLIDEGVRVHSVVTDPPYGLVSIVKRFGKSAANDGTKTSERIASRADGFGRIAAGGFMGKVWDGTGIERDPEFWKLIYDILLPGGYVFAFSGSRTGHWQACAMEQAGFVMHPMHGWVNSQGFPKAHNASKAIDNLLGAERPVTGHFDNTYGINKTRVKQGYRPGDVTPGAKTSAGSPEAAQWEGWAYGTQTQKPALEPIYLGQKPFSEKTGAANLLKHGVGAVNIDGCRVPSQGEENPSIKRRQGAVNHLSDRPAAETEAEGRMVDRSSPEAYRAERPGEALGRHPANLILDGSPEVVALFPDSGGSGKVRTLKRGTRGTESGWGMGDLASELRDAGEGSAARFFHQFPPDTDPIIYHAKAGKVDRAGSKHPTVKPVALLQYLIRHITPPGGVVLDPFAGSGTTGEAAKREGFDCILMEAEDEYIEFLRKRFVDDMENGSPQFPVAIKPKRSYEQVDSDLARLLG